jgi:hypothetical protein
MLSCRNRPVIFDLGQFVIILIYQQQFHHHDQ